MFNEISLLKQKLQEILKSYTIRFCQSKV